MKKSTGRIGTQRGVDKSTGRSGTQRGRKHLKRENEKTEKLKLKIRYYLVTQKLPQICTVI